MNNRLDEKLKTYSILLGFQAEELPALGFSLLHVSIFDHWLSEEEADRSTKLSYSISIKTGNLDRYLSGEKKYLAFYRSLSRSGAICGRPGKLTAFEGYNEKLESILIDSLREHRLADLYFVEPEVRLIAGYDRTDTIAAKTIDAVNHVRQEASAAGLYILP
ncbi:hypothetical protein [Rhizobium sp. R693]|uniref:hypothetical protein n=1 Tax=Rhizobium sp. R693 TaxID=1764276 RepID=UPI000B529917|nr:hypothetical protein [Rhizobium sp. R693]OWV99187.1 hypothetical protein ATY79_18550 [Rhizobium sp. R693]